MGAAGSVASPSRLMNNAVRTVAPPGGNDNGPVVVRFGAVTVDEPPALGAHPWDTLGPVELYEVRKMESYDNTAGITLGQNPVAYNPMLSRVVGAGGKPSAPLTAGRKGIPNDSWREEFHQFAQRFPVGPAAPGMGQYLVENPYYPGNKPVGIVGADVTGNAVAGKGTTGRSVSPAFVKKGGRGMVAMNQNRQTRLGSAISYSSTTDVIGQSIFNEGPLGSGTVTGG